MSKLPASDLINPQLDLDNEPLPIERTLGVFYDAEANTKRQMFSSASSVYDPDGLATPVTIKSRCILQDIWYSKTDWDEAELKIRAFALHRIDSVEIWAFADKSQLAYGVVIYIRCKRPRGEFGVAFLTSKVHVAPTRHVTIPRLELKALLLAVQLTIKA